MKKTILTLILSLCVFSAFAQEVTTIYHPHKNYKELYDMMECRDSSLVLGCPIYDANFNDTALVLYKMSREGSVLDSLYLESTELPIIKLERDPIGEGNVLVQVENRYDDTTAWLRMTFFSDDLEILDEKRVMLHDSLTKSRGSCYCLDPVGDVIVTYRSSGNFYLARVGLDGTLKTRSRMPELPGMDFFQYHHLGLYNRSPLQYCFWGCNTDDGGIYVAVVDSLLQFDTMFHCTPGEYGSFFGNGFQEQIVYQDDDTYYVHSYYDKWSPQINGVHVSKFNKKHELLNQRVFKGKTEYSSQCSVAAAVGSQGGVFYAYNDEPFNGQIVVVKLDENLNVEWYRVCLEPYDGAHMSMSLRALSDGKVAVGGWDSAYGPEYHRIFLLILSDEGVSTPEMEAFVKPYSISPNPASDFVRLNVSPDIHILRVELYDAGGRLVLSQEGDCTQVDISRLASGSYILKMHGAKGKTWQEKIVKE